MAVMRTAAVAAWSGAAVVAVLLIHAADAFVVNTAGVCEDVARGGNNSLFHVSIDLLQPNERTQS